MSDPTKRLTRRNVLKATGGALAGLGGVLAADSASAMKVSVHRKMGRISANTANDSLNNGLGDYVDTISDYSDDPDYDPYDCGYWVPDEVCKYLKMIDQSTDHYKNPNHPDGPQGTADNGAANEAEAAKNRVDGNDYVQAAIKSGRSLHFIQDIGTLPHTGREAEQIDDMDIHYDFEAYIRDNWDAYFKDDAQTSCEMVVDEKGDVQYWANSNAEMSHSRLQDQWWDISIASTYYYPETRDAQGWSIDDAACLSNGMLQWAWQNA